MATDRHTRRAARRLRATLSQGLLLCAAISALHAINSAPQALAQATPRPKSQAKTQARKPRPTPPPAPAPAPPPPAQAASTPAPKPAPPAPRPTKKPAQQAEDEAIIEQLELFMLMEMLKDYELLHETER